MSFKHVTSIRELLFGNLYPGTIIREYLNQNLASRTLCPTR